MPSLGWCLCFLALWHGQLIDASPNNGIMVTKESSLGTQETSPDSMPQNTPGSLEKSATPPPPQNSNWNQKKWSPIISTQATAQKLNNQKTWDPLQTVVIRIIRHNHTYQFQLNGFDSDRRNNNISYAVDIIDVADLSPPVPNNTHWQFTYRSGEYSLTFSSYEEAKKFYQAMADAKEETSRLINQHQSSTDIVQQQNVNKIGESPVPTKHEQDEAHPSNPADSSTHQLHICSISTHYYDCQIQGVRIIEGVLHGFRHEPEKQRITFRDSVLRYVPKSLIDAFPKMELLNLNQAQVATIEENAFENATKLKELFLANNRLQTFPVNVLNGARNLEKLVLTSNHITNMAYSFESNILLNDLFVDKNKISQLPSFENIPNLKTFNGSSNALDHIEWNQFLRQTQLEDIDLSYNQLTNLDLQLSSKVLNTVDIRNNKLAKLRITLQMSHLNIENNVLSEFVIDQVCLLETLKMSNNKLASQPNFTNCQSLEILDVSNNALENFRYAEKLENLKKLNLAHNNLFEFSIPAKTKKQLKLNSLDLSHNKLSYLISLPSFTSLKKLKLNNNQLLGIHKNPLPKAVQYLYVSNNKWNCDDVTSFANLVKDQVQNCTAEFHLIHGICCKPYRKPFNDVLNEMVKHTYFHEQLNYDRLKNKCLQRQYNTQNTDIEKIRQLASEADRSRSQIYEEIASAKEKVTTKQSELNTIQNKHHKSDNFKSNMAILIENKREAYYVTKEGLITDKEMLSRVIHFVRQRNTFSTDLWNRRKNEAQSNHILFDQKTAEKEQIKANIDNLKIDHSEMKKKEKVLKKQMDELQKRVNKNAPSIYGKNG
ncbi:uncharacterized protein LOC109411523 isoform X6 [Aedes albopictus]|uniref:Uncharacterized protein n=1 Tax=Aedes albopictus TaxID=7160 RepID=A0ABM1ZW37_AEDAL